MSVFRRPKGALKAARFLALLMAAALGSGCGGKDATQPGHAIPMAPFIEAARRSSCHDVRNRLFIIDRHLVFWDRAGTCPDNGYAQILYAGTPQAVLCERRDSLGGEVRAYPSTDHRELFDTAVANLDQPDLGLSRTHSVEAIRF